MPRYRLLLEYDGAGFVGWQRQNHGPSIQQALESACHAFCGQRVALVAAGRTDAGVHALGQVAHVDLARAWPAATVRDALNARLRPLPIAVLAASRAADAFHARFDAVERRYLYRIVARRAPLALERGRAWRLPRPLDVAAMHAAAQRLVGRHDFSTFRDAQCQAASPVKTLDALAVTGQGETVAIAARARSFLHRQMRSMVGSLRLVGEGKWSGDDLAAALAARNRQACAPIAPAHGLYLAAVRYGGEESAAAGARPPPDTPANGL